MIVRIVRMTFSEGNADAFHTIFEKYYDTILGMPGCSHLELLQDIDDPDVFVTHSHWESVEDLNAYRQTDFFVTVWTETKKLFREKAIAFSLKQV
jgi:quinol monooxygenase YgiN